MYQRDKLDNCTKSGLAAWQIKITNSTGYSASTTTDANGKYEFCHLWPGQYTLSETMQNGYIAGPGPVNPVTLPCGANLTNQNFTNLENGNISGYKIDQSAGNGISGWSIKLYNATSGALIKSATTDSKGKYSFTGLCFGSYTVSETLQTDWTAITPATVQVTITQNNPSTIVNFTNYKVTYCCSCSPLPQFSYTNAGRNSSGYLVQFTDTSVGPRNVKWAWDFGDGSTSTLQNPLHVYKRSGSYTVKMSIKWIDCSGQTSTLWKSVTKTVRVS